MTKKKSILIIAYKFCPRGGVGTRRWSKFAKYLSKDFHVHILSAKYHKKDNVQWCSDVLNNSNIHIYNTKSYYPDKYINHNNTNIFKFLLYHFLRNTFFYFDYSQHWHHSYIELAQKLIKRHDIINVIVTGPPFAFIHHTITLKDKFPSINLILDYRDPWNFVAPLKHYGKIFGEQRRKSSIKFETKTIQKANTILFISNSFKEAYTQYFIKHESKFKTLYNGFDPQDNLSSPNSIYNKNNKILKVVYGGNLNDVRGRKNILLNLLRAIYELNDPFFTVNFKLDIYTNQPKIISLTKNKYIQDLYQRIVTIKPLLPYSDYKLAVTNYSTCLSLSATDQFFAVPTKLVEYLSMNKSILHIGPNGEVHQILDNLKQYTSYEDVKSIKKTILNLKTDFQKGELKTPQSSQIQKFSIPQLTSELTRYLV